MSRRREPTVKMDRFTEAEQRIIIRFLADRSAVVQHAYAVARDMRRQLRNEHTLGQLTYEGGRAKTMAWLLSTLPLHRINYKRTHGEPLDDRLLERIYKTVDEDAA